VVKQLERELKAQAGCARVCPSANEGAFRGVVDLISMKGFHLGRFRPPIGGETFDVTDNSCGDGGTSR